MATRSPDLSRILSFSRLEKPVKAHLQNVYTSLALAMLAATVGAYVHLFTQFQAGLLTLIGSLGTLILLALTPHSPANQSKRFGLLIGFAFFDGIALGPLINVAINIDPSILPTALLGTTMIFVSLSLAALLSDDRKFIYLGGTLMSGLSFMLVLGLMNIFFRSRLIFQVELYLGLIIMCLFVLYDTQLIVEKRRRGDDDYVWHSVDLFIDFVSIFRRLLIILADKESNKKKRRD